MTLSPQESPQPAPSRRYRWLRFSLRAMLVLVLLLAIPLGFVAGQFKIVRERKAVLAEIGGVWRGNSRQVGILEELEWENKNSSCGTCQSKTNCEYIRVSRLRKLLGDVSIAYIAILPRKDDTKESFSALVRRLEEAFPEAVLEVGGHNYRDSLFKPMSKRKPNEGTLFKTGKFAD